MPADELVLDRQRPERHFFSGMALLILTAVVIGFARTYYLRGLLPVPTPAPLDPTGPIHVHALLFTGWVVLLLIQARLIAGKRVGLHRRVGMASAVVAATMVGTGTLVAIQAVLRGVSPFGMDPRAFLIIPLIALALFATFVVGGVLMRHDAQSHKRLMLLATIALLPPAIARWVLPLGFAPPVVLIIATLFLVPLVFWDLKTLRRLHPVTLWGGLLLVVSGPLRLALARTEGWLAISDGLVGLAR